MEKGRNCSLEYILKKDWTKKIKKIEETVIYVVGGLYGNSFALEIINKMAQDENAKLKDQLLRTIAEFDNFRKRTNKEKAELILNGGRKAVTDILPILDDFERALSNETKDATAIKEGMQMIFNKFIKKSLCTHYS